MEKIDILKDKRNAVKEQIYHPLLNVDLPSVADLKARCIDEDAVSLLNDACQLATYRFHSMKKSDYNGFGGWHR